MLIVYTLETCPHCKALLNMLDEANIKYINLDADIHDDLATKVEDTVNTALYPIVHISKGLSDIYLTAEEGYHVIDNDDLKIITYMGIPHLFTLIRQHI